MRNHKGFKMPRIYDKYDGKTKKRRLLSSLTNTVEIPKQMQYSPFLGRIYPFLISLIFAESILKHIFYMKNH
jgi:hypothetical protein